MKSKNQKFSTIRLIGIPQFCPFCGEELKIDISDSGVKNLVCQDKDCPGKSLNGIIHFCSKKGMDIKGLSSATLEKLYDLKWIDSILDIYKLKEYRNEWILLKGFGEKSVDNILSAIQKSLENVDLVNFLSGLGIKGMGQSLWRYVLNELKITQYIDFRKKIYEHFDFTKINKIGTISSNAILNFSYIKDADEIAALMTFKEEEEEEEEEEQTPQKKTLENQVFCITGKLVNGNRKQLEEKIKKAGGICANSVTKKVNFLIANKEETSEKYKKALSLNIPIISEQNILDKLA